MEPKPTRHLTVGSELVVGWDDGAESYIPLERLRAACPCASCAGEADLLGRVHRGPQTPLGPKALELRELEPIGGYALQPVWGDGHDTGIFSFGLLRHLGRAHSG